tara:strand:+ start:83 stop:268 length:186 start_codon:yes stop_codon:yes gene_type:complete
METLYTVHEVAKMFKINYRKVLDEITIGRLVAVKIGRQYRITEGSLRAYLQDNTIEKDPIF